MTNTRKISQYPLDVQSLSGFRNKIINGNFNITQRGTVFSVPSGQSVYTADRWVITNGTNQTATVNIYGIATDDINVPPDTKSFLNINFAVAPTTGSIYAVQRIEDVRILVGKYATATYYAASSAPGSTYTSYLEQRFGTGGSDVVPITSNLVLKPLPTPDFANAKRSDIHGIIPSVVGKTLGTNHYLALVIQFIPRTAGDYYLTRVSLVEGDATLEDDPFSPRHPQQEIALCLRYYRRYQFRTTWSAQAAGDYFSLDISNQSANMRLPVPTIASVGGMELTNAGNFAAVNHVQVSWQSLAAGPVIAGGILSFDAEL